MQLTKGTFLLLTLCLSCGDIWAKPSLDLLQDIWNGLGDATHDILDELATATKNGAEITKDLLGDLNNAAESALHNTLEISEQISNAISEALNANLNNLSTTLQSTLTDLETLVSEETNRIKRNALTSGLDALKVLNSNIDNLKEELSNISEQIGGTVESQVNEAIKELQEWGENQLERVNNKTAGAGTEQANDLIQSVILRFNHALSKSLEELDILTTLFERDVNEAIETYTRYARELIDQMNRCKAAPAVLCRININILSEKVLTSTNQLIRLRRSGQQLIESGLYATQRVENLLTQLVKDMLKCEKDLDGIIEDNKDEQADGSGDSDSSDESSNSSDSSDESSNSSDSSDESSNSSDSSDSSDESSKSDESGSSDESGNSDESGTTGESEESGTTDESGESEESDESSTTDESNTTGDSDTIGESGDETTENSTDNDNNVD
ncbi:uncharacterized protein LOC117782300 isoform X2 [Drosophila innubila]|uniref:uncharacterized protein LOC117782300 isoform X2 n=1 Tax=Drosophila innubila TaxID=198719 RepID=UPI00148CD2CC|nr:uncharacterized protein LOC117782300 isoform X2 [Drosophila innubila]